MIIRRINILSDDSIEHYDAICFTSNNIIKNNGALVMGAGVAKAFKNKIKDLDTKAGHLVKLNGNVCQVVMSLAGTKYNSDTKIVSFPTKNHWRNPSDIKLIKRSAEKLMSLANEHGWKRVALPKPGCFNGGLSWDDVKDIIKPILDHRITIVYL